MGAHDPNVEKIILSLIRTHRFDLIPEYRALAISAVVSGLKKENGIVNIDEIFLKRAIEIVESPKVIEPRMVSMSNLETYRPPIVFLPTYGEPEFRRWYKAHELGHAMLHDDMDTFLTDKMQKEREANFFARGLVGLIPLRRIRDEQIRRERMFSEEPLKMWKAEYERDSGPYLVSLIKVSRISKTI